MNHKTRRNIYYKEEKSYGTFDGTTEEYLAWAEDRMRNCSQVWTFKHAILPHSYPYLTKYRVQWKSAYSSDQGVWWNDGYTCCDEADTLEEGRKLFEEARSGCKPIRLIDNGGNVHMTRGCRVCNLCRMAPS